MTSAQRQGFDLVGEQWCPGLLQQPWVPAAPRLPPSCPLVTLDQCSRDQTERCEQRGGPLSLGGGSSRSRPLRTPVTWEEQVTWSTGLGFAVWSRARMCSRDLGNRVPASLSAGLQGPVVPANVETRPGLAVWQWGGHLALLALLPAARRERSPFTGIR